LFDCEKGEIKLKRKVALGIMLTLLLTSMLALAFNIQQAKASGTIYIKADGSVDPSDAPIFTVDNVTYTFTGNINDLIVVERNNIVVEGAGYTVQGTGSGTGVDLTGRSNVTIKNMKIKEFDCGIWLYSSSNNGISGNSITNNGYGVELYDHSSNNSICENTITANEEHGVLFWGYCSSNNILRNNISTNNEIGILLGQYSNFNNISANVITANNQHGITLQDSSYNSVSGNNLTANRFNGIYLTSSSYNTVSGNHITGNYDGIELNQQGTDYNKIFENNVTANTRGIYLFLASENVIYHNNFINNSEQVHVLAGYSYANFWDDGYPSGGNYWSDYDGTDIYGGLYQNETGSDGIGDTPFTVDVNSQDRFPLIGSVTAFDADTWNGVTYNANVMSNSTVSKFQLNVAQKMMSFNVTGEAGLGFCRVTIPNVIVQDLWHGNYTILLNGDPWPFKNWTDTENTYIYFTYQHSEHEVTIMPEFPSLILPLFMVFTTLIILLVKRRLHKKPKTRNMLASFLS